MYHAKKLVTDQRKLLRSFLPTQLSFLIHRASLHFFFQSNIADEIEQSPSVDVPNLSPSRSKKNFFLNQNFFFFLLPTFAFFSPRHYSRRVYWMLPSLLFSSYVPERTVCYSSKMNKLIKKTSFVLDGIMQQISIKSPLPLSRFYVE